MFRKQLSQTQKGVARALIGAIVVFAILHVLAVLLEPRWPAFAQSFNLDSEWNAPTLYSGMLWAGCAFMTIILATQTKLRAERWRWYAIGALFLYIAFDELLIIHERYAEPIRGLLSLSDGNWFYHAWVILAIIAVVGLLILVGLIRSQSVASVLQKRVIIMIAIAAAGAVILEIIGTQVYVSPRAYQLGPVFIEEIFEISIVSFILFKLTSAVVKPGSAKA